MSRIDVRQDSQIVDEIVFGGDEHSEGGQLLLRIDTNIRCRRPVDIVNCEEETYICLTEDELDHLILALQKAKDVLAEIQARARSQSIR